MASYPLNSKVKSDRSSPQEQTQEPDPAESANTGGSENVMDDTDGQNLSSIEDNILDLSYIKTFVEAQRQAKANGASQFKWRPNKYGNDVYSTGIAMPGQGQDPSKTPDNNGQPAPQIKEEQKEAPQQGKKPGLGARISKMFQ